MGFISDAIQHFIHSEVNEPAAKLAVLCVCLFLTVFIVNFLLRFIPLPTKGKEITLMCSVLGGAFLWYSVTFT
ncbi:hypothetical protein SAMN05216353_12523 [Halobacillus alkaliphilus]|uniref:Uncharacterized protein n=1 Tax=Halobacillus alkaliphilus TaxID=396056 RepID=A0A1I2PLW1_9BACI|nr:hypothetical protein [Halobacillus alkaliphilus]SFG14977.1 hypothetical protein SAMN05216353_12523 [Halobacillus alkaliphilus]